MIMRFRTVSFQKVVKLNNGWKVDGHSFRTVSFQKVVKLFNCIFMFFIGFRTV